MFGSPNMSEIDINSLMNKLEECIINARSELEDEECGNIFKKHSHELGKLQKREKLKLMEILPIGIISFICSDDNFNKLCYKNDYWKNKIMEVFGKKIESTHSGENYKIFKELYALKSKYMRVYRYTRQDGTNIKLSDLNIGKLIGEGGYGRVYIATVNKDLPVVVKIMNKKLINDEVITREIENQSIVNSPYIAKIYTTFEDDDNIYIVMEYCSQGDLFDFRPKYLMPLDKVRDIIKQITLALIETHSKGITHRDVKLENILVCGDDNYKLTDYGLSDNNKVMHTMTGTLDYISPDILSGEYDNRTDIWSLGVLLYILLYNRMPFHGETDGIIIQKIKLGDYKNRLNRNDHSIDLLSRMLEVNVDERISLHDILLHPFIKEEEDANKKEKGKRKKKEDIPNFMTPPKKKDKKKSR